MVKIVVPSPDIDPGNEPVTLALISPEGADADREVPGFFIIQLDGEYIWPEGKKPSEASAQVMPRQFLSLDAVHSYLREQYGWKVPLRVTHYVQTMTGGPRDFPAIWGADRKIGNKRVQVRVRYLGSFAYWNGRRVDPTVVGTSRESNLN